MIEDNFTIKSELVDVGNGHKIYTQLWGKNSSESPIIFLHGGPGGQAKDKHKKIITLQGIKCYFLISVVAGKSLPYGEIKNNITDDILEDITKLADHYGFDKFSLDGGSWGSTLALLYAIKNPDRIENLYLNGVFAGTKKEIDHIEKGMFKQFFPDNWGQILSEVPERHHDNPGNYLMQNILGDNIELAKKSAYINNKLEGGIFKLEAEIPTSPIDEEYDYLPDKIYAHYLTNYCFIPENYIFDNAHKIKAKTYIIQGRYDMICPGETAYKISQTIPDCQLIWTVAGHIDRATIDAKKALLASHY